MRPLDRVIWDRFIDKQPHAFKRVWYDLHIGDPCCDEALRADMHASGAFEVAQWCIDVVADDGRDFFIIEIKPAARASALGQALAYAALLNAEKKDGVRRVPAVLTDEIIPITASAAALLGVVMLEA